MQRYARNMARLVVLVTASLAGSGAFAYEKGEFLIRGGVAGVFPNDSSGDIRGFEGNGVRVDGSYGLGLSFAYMLSDRVGIELLGASPFTHDIHAAGPDLSGLGKIAEVQHLPPTLLVNYHFRPLGLRPVHPYLGIGVNHTFFFEEEASRSLEGALGKTDIDLDSSTGLALQAGVDLQLSQHWMINTALWLVDIDTRADLDYQGDPDDPDDDGSTSVNVDIDPYVLMLAATYRF